MKKVFFLLIFLFMLTSCSSDADKPEVKNDDAALLQAMGVKAEEPAPQQSLQVEVVTPKFDENKPQIEVALPKHKGSSLDY